MESKKTYGTKRIKKALFKLGLQVSRRRIKRLMRAMALVCVMKKRFKATTDSNHGLPVAENKLNRQFKVQAPDRCYVGDITYIPTQEGWLYLAVVIDLFSRRVVGWAMASHMRAELANKALLMALWQRKPKAGLLSHTDRGSQYASESHRQILKDHGIVQSMSRKGNCWDNAVSESFFHTLKTEWVHHINYKTREEAKQSIFKYIETFYNRTRMHSANDYMSPVEFENINKGY
jgi:transposase InsO family protein